MAVLKVSARLVLASTALLTSVGSALPSPHQPSEITWDPCPAELGLPARMECATYSVPIDWNNKDGEHFDLGLTRLPATNPSKRIGNLYVSPGGPGFPTSFFLAAMVAIQETSYNYKGNDDVQAYFDVIGMDERGTALSGQVECDMSIYAEPVSLWPESKSEYDKLVDKNRRFGQSCLERTGPLLEFMDTKSTVKDYEALRIALGDEPMNLLGISYGTEVGVYYAEMYPDNLRTLVLDGTVMGSLPETTSMMHEGAAMSLSLRHFFEWAGENEASALKGEDVEKLWTSMLSKAREMPLTALLCDGTDCVRDVTDEDILFFAELRLIWKGPSGHPFGGEWGTLASALYNATQGDASAFAKRLDDPSPISFLGIGCLIYPRHASETYEVFRIKKKIAEEYWPLTRGAGDWWKAQHACLGWPFATPQIQPKHNITTDTTILIAQSPWDQFGLVSHAIDLRYEIKNQALLIRDGEGHTNWLHGGEAAEIITKYLLTGEVPKDGTIVSS